MGEIALALRDLWKQFGSTVAVRGVSLELKHGDFVSLLGPSGCGKTTVLRSIAGHLQPDAGTIELGGRDVTRVPAYRRNIGMVFQNYALFPHMSVWENVAFGLRMQKFQKRELMDRVEEALDMVRLADLGRRNPRELSGGQQQRVALARAIVIRPRLLLLDEPLSNLDAKLRKNMQIELRRLQESLGITTVHVTHDQEEALSLSDRVVILWEGRLEQEGPPVEIYGRPASAFVADFVGKANLFRGRVTEREEKNGLVRVTLESGDRLEVPLDRALTDALPGARIWFGIRPEAVRVLHASDGAARANVMHAVVRRTIYGGSTTTTIFTTQSGLELVAEEQNADTLHLDLCQGQAVDVHLPTEATFLVKGRNHHDEGEANDGAGSKPDGGGNFAAPAG